MDKTLGEIAFDAYVKAKHGVTHDSKIIPPWSSLGDNVRNAWEAAAQAVSQSVMRTAVHGGERDAS